MGLECAEFVSTSLCANLSTTPLRQTALLPSGGGVLGKHPNTDQRGTCPSGLLPIPCQWQLIGHALELFSASAYQASHLGVRSRMEQDHADTAVESTFIRDADGACSGLLVSSNVVVAVVVVSSNVFVVVWWWWRHGGVWRDGCHWLHIHVPPTLLLLPTILHQPGHQTTTSH